MQTMPIAALIYDFDLTLSPRYMQEYAYLPGIRMDPPEFWGACRDFQEANQVDGVLAYMYMVVEKAKGVMELTRGTFHQLGAQVGLNASTPMARPSAWRWSTISSLPA